ncbi:MAG TPA: thioredoxin family protein [Alphaproteobacteria bacterium]|nr:thioredoxin family protein [Alphaproteobacteria bacterium]
MTVTRRRFLEGSSLAVAGGALLAGGAGALLLPRAADAAPAVGKPAPAFSATDIAGKPVSLEALKGKVVVLEWTNHQCPFVVKHYGSGNMQSLQKDYTAKGVVWLTLISNAPGQQGHVSPDEAAAIAKEVGASHTAKILDPEGTIGRAYDAKTTPHMYVIGTDGTLLYNGGIDDKPTKDPADIATATPLFRQALDAVLAGKPVPVAVTKPYGCSVKYAKTTA